MKKIIALVLMAALALVPSAAFAKGSDDRFKIQFYNDGVKETTDSNAFFTGYLVNDNSTVNGIYFAFGNTIENGGAYEYGFHAANKIIIQGDYEKDLFAIGNEINISSKASLARDAYILGNVVRLSTDIPGTVFVAGNKISLENITIGGDLRIAASELEILGDVKITGAFVYNQDINIVGNDSITAGTTEPYHPITWGLRLGEGSKIITAILNLAASIVVAIVFILIAKKFFTNLKKEVNTVDAKIVLKNFGFGLLTMIVVPILSVLLAITIIGLPAAAILLLAFVIAVALSTTVTAAFVGNKILPKRGTVFTTTLVLIALALIELIPYVGPFCCSLAAIFGLGIIVRMLFRKQKVVETE